MYCQYVKMLLSIMLTASFILVDCKLYKRHVPNCVEPHQLEEVYNLNGWINTLHLQQCVFVAIGENFFAIFLETIPRQFDEDQQIRNYFIGICDVENLKKWKLCPTPVELKRPQDCILGRDLHQSPRVHRRLCELSELTDFGSRCNCDALFRGEKLFKVVGFPTCFRPQMEPSLCGYNNVCGLSACKMSTVANRVYTVQCDENCFGHKPFCEDPEWVTAKPRDISSFWSDWSDSDCSNDECLSISNEAKCVNKDTGQGDVDCLGPGTSCCPRGLDNCKCHVFIEGGMLRVIRMYSVQPPQEYDEVSLEDFIKNLPLKNEHRQFKLSPRKKHKLLRRLIGNAGSRSQNGRDFVIETLSRKERMPSDEENDDDDDDDDDDIKSIEKDEEENGEDDIVIEEDEETTTARNVDDEDMEARNIKAINEFRGLHENETIVDVPDRDVSGNNSFTKSSKCSVTLTATIISWVLYFSNYVDLY